MKITVKGAPGLPIALLLHPAMQDASYFDSLIDALHGQYRVAIPTMDGHYPGSPDFSDASTEAGRVLFHLEGERIERLGLILACGLGAAIALELLSRRPALLRGNCVLDSAVLGSSHLGEANYLHDLRKVASIASTKPDRARNRVDSRDEPYARTFVDIARQASDATLVNLARASYRSSLPEIAPGIQGLMRFVWGSYDQAGEAHQRVMRAYPAARVEILKGWGANGYLRGDPEGYAKAYLF